MDSEQATKIIEKYFSEGIDPEIIKKKPFLIKALGEYGLSELIRSILEPTPHEIQLENAKQRYEAHFRNKEREYEISQWRKRERLTLNVIFRITKSLHDKLNELGRLGLHRSQWLRELIDENYPKKKEALEAIIKQRQAEYQRFKDD